MLIKYKKSFEKIAMGLLSFMPNEKDVKKLQSTMNEYETNDNWKLFLWKEEDDVLGAIGVRIEENKLTLQHISVTPSHRNSGIGKKMVQAIKNEYGDEYIVCANENTESFYKKCEDE